MSSFIRNDELYFVYIYIKIKLCFLWPDTDIMEEAIEIQHNIAPVSVTIKKNEKQELLHIRHFFSVSLFSFKGGG